MKGARKHLVRHASQRIHVAAAIDVSLPGNLLGAHIVRRPERQPGFGEAIASRGLHREGDAEIRDQGQAVLEEDVLGFDVAMNDATPVRVVERRGDRLGDRHGCVDRELGFPIQLVAERLALDVGHYVVEETVRLTRIEQREDMRVLQIGRRFDLVHEPIAAEDRCQLRAEDLDRDLPLVLEICGEVDGGHATGSQLALDGVAVCKGGREAIERIAQ